MSTVITVDCPHKKITFTWRVWCGGGLNAAQLAQVRADLNRVWNPNPPLKYHECTIEVVMDLKTAATDPVKPKGYDDLRLGPVSPPAGMGMTEQPGGGDARAGAAKRVTLCPGPNGAINPRHTGHEFGHCLGINDPGVGQDWDRNGIKEKHIQEAIDHASIFTGQGWVGWRHDVHCCLAVADAVTDRVTGD